MKGSPTKKHRDAAVMKAYFDWQKEFRSRLLSHPKAKKNPRLFSLGYVLSDQFDWESRSCFPSRELLAVALGVSETQISALTKELADMGFLTVRRRRNSSAIYVGSIPPEVNSTSLLESDKTTVTSSQEVKSSRLRKSTGLHFGKSTALHANVTRNVASNEGDMALKANVPVSDSLNDGSHARDLHHDAPVSAPVGAPGASPACEIPDQPSDAEVDAFVVEIDAAYKLPSGLTRRIRDLLTSGNLTQEKLQKILSLGSRRDAATA